MKLCYLLNARGYHNDNFDIIESPEFVILTAFSESIML